MRDLGLLLLRVSVGVIMASAHGWGKLSNFGEISQRFMDPIGLGAPFALGLVVFAELFCAIALALGLFTRLAAIPLLITMLVAALVAHGDDPWQKKELAVVYASVFGTLMLTGAGRFSLDHRLKLERYLPGLQ